MPKILIGNFTGPQGEPGQQGEQGRQGNKGEKGDKGDAPSTQFTLSSVFANIIAGEAWETLLGKMSRWFTEIGNKLDKESVVNNQVTSHAGYALDARQANPAISGSLGAQVSKVKSDLDMHSQKFITNGASTGWAAMQSSGSVYKYRLQLQVNGKLNLYQSEVGGDAWTQAELIATTPKWTSNPASHGLAVEIMTAGLENFKAVKIMGVLDGKWEAGSTYQIAKIPAAASNLNWYHNVFVSGSTTAIAAYLIIDKSGNISIKPHTAMAAGMAINFMEIYM